ncbi:MAG: hypothetical protein ACKVQC_09210 [Elusimicrobiota bacterium]
METSSSNGSTNIAVKDSSNVDVLTVNSDGGVVANSVTQVGTSGGNIIRNTLTLQSGATFYVSTGTVAGQVQVNSLKFVNGSSTTTKMIARHQRVGHFGLSNLAISQTNLQMQLEVGSAAQVVGGSRIIMPFNGKAVGICVSGSAARTAGTATFQIFKNAVDIGSTSDAVIDGTNTQFVCSSGGTGTFVTGDLLDIRVTTDAALLPAATTEYTASLIVDFWN